MNLFILYKICNRQLVSANCTAALMRCMCVMFMSFFPSRTHAWVEKTLGTMLEPATHHDAVDDSEMQYTGASSAALLACLVFHFRKSELKLIVVAKYF